MTLRRCLLLGLLVYVTLDLSLPAMPGAFVFEPAGSVESAHGGRARPANAVAALPAPPPCAILATSTRLDTRERSMAPADPRRPAHGVVSRLARATLAPSPVSEDPQ